MGGVGGQATDVKATILLLPQYGADDLAGFRDHGAIAFGEGGGDAGRIFQSGGGRWVCHYGLRGEGCADERGDVRCVGQNHRARLGHRAGLRHGARLGRGALHAPGW